MKRLAKRLAGLLLALAAASLSGCSDPWVYGSIGISSGYGGYSTRMGASISIGGQIR